MKVMGPSQIALGKHTKVRTHLQFSSVLRCEDLNGRRGTVAPLSIKISNKVNIWKIFEVCLMLQCSGRNSRSQNLLWGSCSSLGNKKSQSGTMIRSNPSACSTHWSLWLSLVFSEALKFKCCRAPIRHITAQTDAPVLKWRPQEYLYSLLHFQQSSLEQWRAYCDPFFF